MYNLINKGGIFKLMTYNKLSEEEKTKRREERRKEVYNKQHKIIDNKLYKICNRHKIYFPDESEWLPCNEEYFHKNTVNNIDGLFPYCKKCNIEKQMRQIEENKEEFLISANKYYYENRERKLELQKIYESQDHVKERKYLYHKIYTQQNPERIKYYHEKHMQKEHRITTEEWNNCKLYFNNCCAYCGLPLEKHLVKFKGKIIQGDFHKEHIYCNGRNDLKNCVPSCKSCNSEKHETSFNDWYNKDNPKYTYERYHRICEWVREGYKKYIKKKKI